VTQRLLAIVTDAVEGRDSIDALAGGGPQDDLEVRLVMPAVEESPLRHAFGDVDGPARRAEERLEASLEELRRSGVAASGTVGDSDPVLAAQDALRESPADEVVLFEHAGEEARWFENGLFERAREELPSPVRMVVLKAGERGASHVVGIEEDAVPLDEAPSEIEISGNLPRFSRVDFGGMVVGVVGTIVTVVLAAAAAVQSGSAVGWSAVAILIAIGVALINMAHVVGLTLFESVHYRGGWERFFHTLALVGTPLAVLANLAILVFA
jgi:hypothetical protein